MDLEKLTPAPWSAIRKTDTLHLPGAGEIGFADVVGLEGGRYRGVYFPFTNDEAEFIALARNAFDVIMRRRWTPYAHSDGRFVAQDEDGGWIYRFERFGGNGSLIAAADPFTALVEADKWYKENVEKVSEQSTVR